MKSLLLALLLASPAVAATPFEPADLYRLAMVTDPKVAPDGSRVVFTKVGFDIATDMRTSELWLATIRGADTDRRILVPASAKASDAVWSPDGRSIAYVAPFLGKPQLWVMAVDSGVGRMITNGALAPRGPIWSPDGTRIAFVARVEQPATVIPGLPTKPEGATWATPARVIDSFQWRNDGTGYVVPGADHVFVTGLDGSPRQLTNGSDDQVSDNAMTWTPDGRAIIYTARVRPGADMLPTESDLWRVAADGGAPERLTDIDGVETGPSVSPDGKTLAYVGFPATTAFYAQPALWVRPMAGGPPRNLTAQLDRPIIDAKWTRDGRGLYAFYNDAGLTRVALVPVDPASAGRTPKVVVDRIGGTRLYLPSAGGGWSEGNGVFAFTTAESDRPAALGIERQGRRIATVDFNTDWRAGKTIGKLERVTWQSSVGAQNGQSLPIEGWVQYPPDFDPKKKYPLALEIHGGPNGDYGPYFSITHQIYAASGYIVLFSNPRGSIGYGEKFGNAIDRAYPGDDHADLMSGVDAMVKRPYVDAGNLFIGGGSGGGVLTTNAIARTDRFRAAAALRPVTDWTVQALTSDIAGLTLVNWVPGRPWENHDDYWKRSTLSMVGSVKTPTILIDGDADWRTPIAQTEAYYQALKVRGIDTRMVRLDGAGHGMGRPSQWLTSILAVTDWYGRYRVK